MKKIAKWFGLAGGATSSVFGVIGTALLVACPCKVAALSAIVVAVFGTGAAAFLKKYNYLFMIAGVLLFAWGVYALLASRKKKCTCSQSTD